MFHDLFTIVAESIPPHSPQEISVFISIGGILILLGMQFQKLVALKESFDKHVSDSKVHINDRVALDGKLDAINNSLERLQEKKDSTHDKLWKSISDMRVEIAEKNGH